MKAPLFWNQKDSKLARFLNPLGFFYGWSVARRFRKAHPYQADIPVICVGNLSVGGTGKTPVCLTLGNILQKMNIPFFFLNHGYKSQKQGVLVNLKRMTALETGDEAQLLAEVAPTIVDKHRARGAQQAQKRGAKALIMDDGFQDPALIKTLSFLVVDGRTGFGNGRLIPAGPLREPIAKGLSRADAVIIVGSDDLNTEELIKKHNADIPVLKGSFQPDAETVKKLQGQKVLAFAGIGKPNKFFDMLTGYGIPVAKAMPFPDHYFYTRFDIEQLLTEAGDMPLVTTTKDFVKIPQDMRSRITVIRGQFVFDDPEGIENLLKGAVS